MSTYIDPKFIVNKICTSVYIKRKINNVVISCISGISRNIIYILLCIIWSFNNYYINFIFQILLSIFLSYNDVYIYNLVVHFDEDMYLVTSHVINNYTSEDIYLIKNIVIISSCTLTIIYLLLVDITSNILIGYIIQFLVAYITVEYINKYKPYTPQPYTKVYDNINIIEDHIKR